MRILHLVRHGPVNVDLDRPSEEWELAPDGGRMVAEMASKMAAVWPKRIISSHHVKATQTADVLARILNAPVQVRPGLEEHHRDQKDFFETREAFDEAMANFLQKPDEIVLGSESATMALDRFTAAIDTIMAETVDDEVVVTHGAVMALFLESTGNGSAADIWRSLNQPDHVQVSWPGRRVIVTR